MSDPRTAFHRLRAAANRGELAALYNRRGVELLVVFGSAITAKPDPRDLDVAVFFSARDGDTLAAGRRLSWCYWLSRLPCRIGGGH